jgi:hypothetical protein
MRSKSATIAGCKCNHGPDLWRVGIMDQQQLFSLKGFRIERGVKLGDIGGTPGVNNLFKAHLSKHFSIHLSSYFGRTKIIKFCVSYFQNF